MAQQMRTINGATPEGKMVSMTDKGWQVSTAGNYESAGVATANYNYGNRTFDHVAPNLSIKSQYGLDDYNFYRENEMRPHSPIDIINVCNRAYKQVGIIRNIIDLMGEFTCKGIKITHPDARAELFGQEWFKYVKGKIVSERFSNNLYRQAHVPILTTYGKVPIKVSKKWSSTIGELKAEEIQSAPRRMPLNYTFLNPTSIELIAPEISIFTGKPIYGLRIGRSLQASISKLSKITDPNFNISKILDNVPEDIKKTLLNGAKFLPLDSDTFNMYYYKKDDWEDWATPMIYSILPDVITLEKMKLADKSALDGAISNIRLWKIGHLSDNPQTCLIPTAAMLNKLRGILANNVGGGTIDLVWGPDLDFKESNTQVHNFLGIEKYEPIYKNIYEGMGVPSSGGSGEGFNTSFLQMQTLIERLEYGRSILISFWEQELKKVQLAMGYTKPFQIMFDQITLGDDSAIKKLLMDMVDRDIMSVDTLLDKFNCFSNIEKAKIKREYRARQKDNMPNKASPFHNPQSEDEMKKIILNQGGVAPSEMGIDLHPRKPDETPFIEKQAKLMKSKEYAPSAPNGRPANKKDSVKRKQRAVKPSKTSGSNDDFVSRFLWANSAQKKVSDIVTPELVKSFGKTDVRSLTTDEFDRVEAVKFTILCNLEPYTEINHSSIASLLQTEVNVNADIYHAVKTFVYKFSVINDRQPNLEEIRQMQSSAFALYYEDEADMQLEEDIDEQFDEDINN